jgi:hypothetical protein
MPWSSLEHSLALLQVSCKQQQALSSCLQAPKISQQQQKQLITPPEWVRQALQQQALPQAYQLHWQPARVQQTAGL